MTEEDELEKLREQRKEELQDQSGSREEQLEQQREQIKNQAKEFLTEDARERLNNLRVAKPEIASTVEMQIARMGRAGHVEKMDDDELKQILKEVQGSEEDTDIKFRR